METQKIFLTDAKETIGSLLNVQVGVVKFDKYKLTTVPKVTRLLPHGKTYEKKDIQFIVGKGNPLKNENPVELWGHSLDNAFFLNLKKDILFDLLALTNKMDITKGFSDAAAEKISPDRIIKLCEKHGMPVTYNLYPTTQLHLWGFELYNFRYRLFRLARIFATYMAIWQEDDRRLQQVAFSNRRSFTEAIDGILMEGLLAGSELSLAHNEELGFHLQQTAKDLVGAAKMFLAMFITSGQTGAKHIKRCRNPECQAYFHSNHGNTRYCPNCDRRTVWSRKKRGTTKKGDK